MASKNVKAPADRGSRVLLGLVAKRVQGITVRRCLSSAFLPIAAERNGTCRLEIPNMNILATSRPRTADAATLPLPYVPRQLSRSELKHKDIYAFLSPKLDREVWIVGALAFAACLQFEFDIETVSYCERPRALELDGQAMEITYWTRCADGTETLWLLVAASESDPAAAGTHRYRHEKSALEAADRAQVHLQFLFESELVSRGKSTGTWLALLPYVQTAHGMDNYMAIEPRVREQFRFLKSSTFVQIEAALSEFNSHDVRSVVCRAIHEGWLSIDAAQPLHIQTIVKQGACYDL